MDYVAGMAVGLACGIGAGMASGRGAGQKEMAERIRTFAESEGLTLTMPGGQPFALDDLLAAGRDTCAPGRKRTTLLIAAAGIAVMLAIAAGVYFATRG